MIVIKEDAKQIIKDYFIILKNKNVFDLKFETGLSLKQCVRIFSTYSKYSEQFFKRKEEKYYVRQTISRERRNIS